MLCSRTFWYSGVSGACWAIPAGFVGSKVAFGVAGTQWPFQFGYFASAAAALLAAMASTAATATAIAPLACRSDITFLPRFQTSCLFVLTPLVGVDLGADLSVGLAWPTRIHAACTRIHERLCAWKRREVFAGTRRLYRRQESSTHPEERHQMSGLPDICT